MRVVVIAFWLCLAPAAQATVIGFVSQPTTNSKDFAAAVAAREGAITTLDFETHPLGPVIPTFYPGVTLAFSPPDSVAVSDAPPGSGSLAPPLSPGEGPYPVSRHIVGGRFLLTITFDEPVLAVGFMTVDYFNPGGVNSTTLNAYEGPSGTGVLLGSFATAPFNFQTGNMYFVGALSTASDIRSITFRAPGNFNDGIFIDNVEYARVVPEPGTLALVAVQVFLMGSYALLRSWLSGGKWRSIRENRP
ncbi:MAG TPA: hypothetical protein DEP35_17095 [Deltaproteobacteria bacterium]|jgi:hypothetical protein|nr:hypothetical protein [Deltaproteobacteria bacterium]